MNIINWLEIFIKYIAFFKTNASRKTQYFSQNNYVKPKKIKIDSKKYFHDVSIIDTIKANFSSKHTQKNLHDFLISLEKADQSRKFIDLNSGKTLRSSTYFEENPDALKIMLFQDAF